MHETLLALATVQYSSFLLCLSRLASPLHVNYFQLGIYGKEGESGSVMYTHTPFVAIELLTFNSSTVYYIYLFSFIEDIVLLYFVAINVYVGHCMYEWGK